MKKKITTYTNKLKGSGKLTKKCLEEAQKVIKKSIKLPIWKDKKRTKKVYIIVTAKKDIKKGMAVEVKINKKNGNAYVAPLKINKKYA